MQVTSFLFIVCLKTVSNFLHFTDHFMFKLFKCVAEAVLEQGVEGLAELIPGGQYIYAVAKRTFEKFQNSNATNDRNNEIVLIANTGFDEAKEQAFEAVSKSNSLISLSQGRPNPTPEQISIVESFIACIPEAVRQSLKRPEDPTGKSAPSGFLIRAPEDIIRLLPARPPRFKPGQPVPGRAGWIVDKLLGVGGFGEVWFTRHERMASLQGAIKFCLGKTGHDLIHEAGLINRVMQAGAHPNIVPLKDAHLEGETPWLMFEYIDGGNLTDWMHTFSGPSSKNRNYKVILALKQLSEAVAHFHALPQPIVHRDLKPSNILFDKITNNFKITDFGIGSVTANEANRLERTGQSQLGGRLLSSLKGSHTPVYSSPEQRRGNDPDPRDDIHALGVIAYQLLTGRFDSGPGAGADRVLKKINVSILLRELIVDCTSEILEDRPLNGMELVRKLEKVEKEQTDLDDFELESNKFTINKVLEASEASENIDEAVQSVVADSVEQTNLVDSEDLKILQNKLNSILQMDHIKNAQDECNTERSLFEEGLQIARTLQSQLGTPDSLRDMVRALNRLGDFEQAEGNLPAARALFEEGLQIARTLQSQLGTPESLTDVAVSLGRLGDIEQAVGNLPAARALFEETLQIAHTLQDQLGNPNILQNGSSFLNRLGGIEKVDFALVDARIRDITLEVERKENVARLEKRRSEEELRLDIEERQFRQSNAARLAAMEAEDKEMWSMVKMQIEMATQKHERQMAVRRHKSEENYRKMQAEIEEKYQQRKLKLDESRERMGMMERIVSQGLSGGQADASVLKTMLEQSTEQEYATTSDDMVRARAAAKAAGNNLETFRLAQADERAHQVNMTHLSVQMMAAARQPGIVPGAIPAMAPVQQVMMHPVAPQAPLALPGGQPHHLAHVQPADGVACAGCGIGLQPQWKECPGCGQPARPVLPRCYGCGGEVQPSWKACPACGTGLSTGPKACRACGNQVQPNWKACPACGTPQ
jgi:serine/threonine protein kinase